MHSVSKPPLHILGGALLLAAQSSRYVKFPLGVLLSRWENSFFKNNFFYVEAESQKTNEIKPLQFIIWKFVTDEWINEIVSNTMDYYGQPLEEGDYMFILDLISNEINPFCLIRQVFSSVRKKKFLKGIVYTRDVGGVPCVYLINLPKV